MNFEQSIAAFAAWLALREAAQARRLTQPQELRRRFSARAERARDALKSDHAECRAILAAFNRLVVESMPPVEGPQFLARADLAARRMAEGGAGETDDA